MQRDEAVVPLAEIERRILTLRGQKVMLDRDLADLYGVSTKRLNEQVRRNPGRFPPDFMFQLSAEEASSLRSQFATSKPGSGGRRYLPYAFTEHGAIMLANVLNTSRAAEVSVYVVRAFVRLRQMAGMNAAMAEKLAELERRVTGHDEAIRSLVQTIRQLMTPPATATHPPTRRGMTRAKSVWCPRNSGGHLVATLARWGCYAESVYNPERIGLLSVTTRIFRADGPSRPWVLIRTPCKR